MNDLSVLIGAIALLVTAVASLVSAWHSRKSHQIVNSTHDKEMEYLRKLESLLSQHSIKIPPEVK